MASTHQYLTKQEIIQKGLAVDAGLCVMCGLCVAVCPVANIRLADSGTEPHQIIFGDRCNNCGICYKVCPGKDIPLRDLDNFVFGRQRDPKKEVLGIKIACYQANATDPKIRASGACGGVATSLLIYALEKKHISGATVVAFGKEQPWKAKPVLATTREEIIEAANSKYAIVPAIASLAESSERKLPGRLGCVGLPCQVHGLRKLQYYYPDHCLSKKATFIIGIHCGSNSTMGQTEFLLKKCFSIKTMDEINSLRYRKGKAPNVNIEVVKTNGEVITLGRYVWSQAVTVARRCLLCWDWGAEVSDVSVGDFFGPAASGSKTHLGASTLIVRTRVGEQMVKEAVGAGYLKIYPTPVEPVIRSRGVMHKKFGVASTLMAFNKYGFPHPDFQYPIEPMEAIERVSLASGVSIEEREQFWDRMGIRALV